MDIAGLVKGASQGAGLGNEFLSHISEVDGIFHVCRAFKDDEIEHVEGNPRILCTCLVHACMLWVPLVSCLAWFPFSIFLSPLPSILQTYFYSGRTSHVGSKMRCEISVSPVSAGSVDPIRDLDIISQELRLKDIANLKREIEGHTSFLKRNNDKIKKEELELMQKIMELLESGKDVRSGEWANKDIDFINTLLFLTAKNVVFLVNIAETDFETQKNKWYKGIRSIFFA